MKKIAAWREMQPVSLVSNTSPFRIKEAFLQTLSTKRVRFWFSEEIKPSRVRRSGGSLRRAEPDALVSGGNPGSHALQGPGDDLNDRFDVADFVQGLELELPDKLGQDRLLFHQRELLADAVAGAGGKWHVGVRVAGSPGKIGRPLQKHISTFAIEWASLNGIFQLKIV